MQNSVMARPFMNETIYDNYIDMRAGPLVQCPLQCHKVLLSMTG
jgi:hypothetical protein